MANFSSLQRMFQTFTVPDHPSETGGIGLNPGTSSSLQQPSRASDRVSYPILPPPYFVPLPTPQNPRPYSPTPVVGVADPRSPPHYPSFRLPLPPQFISYPPPQYPPPHLPPPSPSLPRPSRAKGKSWDPSVDALPHRAHHHHHHPSIHVPPPPQMAHKPLPELPPMPMTKGKNREEFGRGVVEDHPFSATTMFGFNDDDSMDDEQDPLEDVHADPFGESESGFHISDIEYAIALQIEEIETLNDTLEDEEIARRLQAEIDGVAMPPPPTPPNVTPPRYNLRPRRSTAASNAGAGRSTAAPPASVANSTQSVSKVKRECTSCYDTLEHFEGLRGSCGHYYCFTCVRSMVDAGLEGGSAPFPPRCCQTLLVPDEEKNAPEPSSSNNNQGGNDGGKEEEGRRQIQLLGLVLDDPQLTAKMETKWRELSVEPGDRVYCSNARCSSFLGSASSPPPPPDSSSSSSAAAAPSSFRASAPPPPAAVGFFRRFSGSKTNATTTTTTVLSHRLQCQQCSTLTCVACKQIAHAGQSCTEKVDNQFWDLVNVKNWKRCPHCKAVVEKNGGCSNVQCRCGRPFTYA